MESNDELDYAELVARQNRKKKAGGFQSFGLDSAVLRGILKKGYKIPTPIQRKAIPLILSGRDVVSMARTGSGKTAAFLIPLFQKLKCRSAVAGFRALLISPTRELAFQTFSFANELGKFTGLKAVVLVGGESLEDHFAALHANPDIVIATPGRLLHVVVEMNLSLKSVVFVVFDEADRLFEMGFEEQLREVLKRLPDNRQTLLFSATLPKSLLEFGKAGLTSPILVRLDVDSKISDKLKLSHVLCRDHEKPTVLVHLLREVIPSDRCQQTLVFCATKHHVEFIAAILQHFAFRCAYLYSSMNSEARKKNIDAFRNRKAGVLVVTDLAARGVDLPLLDNVVNFHFPGKPKMFVHRVGRAARAGRSGTAVSLIAPDEVPYLFDLYMFLGRALHYATPESRTSENDVVGIIPLSVVERDDTVQALTSGNGEIADLHKSSSRAYKQYIRTRPACSGESIRRVKSERMIDNVATSPIFSIVRTTVEQKRQSMLGDIKNFRPKATIFELNVGNKAESCATMKAKRKAHQKKIAAHREQIHEENAPACDASKPSVSFETAEPSSNADLKNVFSKIIQSKFYGGAGTDKPKKRTKLNKLSDETKFFVPFKPKDFHSEHGLAVDRTTFESEAQAATVDFDKDEAAANHRVAHRKKWDRKRKKFAGEPGSRNQKKIKTESGVLIPASYKSDLYENWKKKYKVRPTGHNEPLESAAEFHSPGKQKLKGAQGKGKSELKSVEQVVKERVKKERLIQFQKYRRNVKSKRKHGKT